MTKDKTKKPSKNSASSLTASPTDREAAVKVYGMLLEGHSRPEIEEAIKTLYPKLDAGQLVGTALTAFERLTNEPPRILKGWCLEASRDLYRKMLEVGDFTGALRAISEANKIGEQIRQQNDDDF
jgi:hypothetical protein